MKKKNKAIRPSCSRTTKRTTHIHRCAFERYSSLQQDSNKLLFRFHLKVRWLMRLWRLIQIYYVQKQSCLLFAPIFFLSISNELIKSEHWSVRNDASSLWLIVSLRVSKSTDINFDLLVSDGNTNYICVYSFQISSHAAGINSIWEKFTTQLHIKFIFSAHRTAKSTTVISHFLMNRKI